MGSIGILHWLKSHWAPVVVERLASAVTPGLSVVLREGRLRLDAARANYSYGELQQVWREVFDEIALPTLGQPRILSLGLGAGGVLRLLRRRYPSAALTAVELDPAVVVAARRWFGLDRLHVEVHVAEAGAWVATAPTASYELIVADVFVDDVVPAAAESPDYLRHLRRLAAPGGVVLVNRITDSPAQRGRTAEVRTHFERLFPTAEVYRLPANEVWAGRV